MEANGADETQGEVQIRFFLTRDTILTPIGKLHDGMRISVAVPILPCLNLEAVDEIPNHRKLLHPPRSNTTTTEWRSWTEYGCQEQKMASRERPSTDYPRKKKTNSRLSQTTRQAEHSAQWDKHPHAFTVFWKCRKLSFLQYTPFVLRHNLFTIVQPQFSIG